MKKILSKVLIAISVFNGVNVSTGAMEENPVNLLNLQTGVSNSWKEWAQNERKRITDVVDQLIQTEWKWCRHFRVDLGESERESDSIDKQMADDCTDSETREQVSIPTFLPKEWQPINDYDKKFERLSWPYLFYGRGMCRNRAAWLLRCFFRNSIFARIVFLKAPTENNTNNNKLNHAVVLYAMPDENCENKWNYYVADMMLLNGKFNDSINKLKEPVVSLPEGPTKYYRDECMQIPLKTYLNSKKYWCGVGFIVEFVYSEPSLGFMDSVYKQIKNIVRSDAEREINEGKTNVVDEYNQRLISLNEEYFKYRSDRTWSDPRFLSIACAEGRVTKEEASKRGVTDLTMWCQKNCPEVLE